MKINYLDDRTTTLALNVGMFKWPCWALQCDFQLHSFYLQLCLSRGGHSSFPPFIVREIVQSQSFTVWITPFLPWKKPQLIKVFNNLMNVSKNIHEKKTNKKRYLGAVHKWRHHFWRVYTPHYGLTGRPIKNAKVPKKVRNGAQKSGMMTRNLEHQFFSSVIENYIRYSALHQIFCVTVPSSGSILFHN